MAKLKKTDIKGTVHDLQNQLVNLSQLDTVNPKTTAQKNKFRKLFNKYKLFHKNLSEKSKKEIITNLKVMNFDEKEIVHQLEVLKAIEKVNRIINKKRREVEDEIYSGKNVKRNDLILKQKEKVEINIPKDVRNILNIRDKAIKLRTYSTNTTRNRLDYYSGQNYKFVLKTGFGSPLFIDYNELQRIRKTGNVVAFVLEKFRENVERIYAIDKSKFFKKKKEWKQKQKIFDKIFKAIDHNLAIATDSTYRKKLVKRKKNGQIEKEEGEYPIQMKIFDELIDVYIP